MIARPNTREITGAIIGILILAAVACMLFGAFGCGGSDPVSPAPNPVQPVPGPEPPAEEPRPPEEPPQEPDPPAVPEGAEITAAAPDEGRQYLGVTVERTSPGLNQWKYHYTWLLRFTNTGTAPLRNLYSQAFLHYDFPGDERYGKIDAGEPCRGNLNGASIAPGDAYDVHVECKFEQTEFYVRNGVRVGDLEHQASHTMGNHLWHDIQRGEGNPEALRFRVVVRARGDFDPHLHEVPTHYPEIWQLPPRYPENDRGVVVEAGRDSYEIPLGPRPDIIEDGQIKPNPLED